MKHRGERWIKVPSGPTGLCQGSIRLLIRDGQVVRMLFMMHALSDATTEHSYPAQPVPNRSELQCSPFSRNLAGCEVLARTPAR